MNSKFHPMFACPAFACMTLASLLLCACDQWTAKQVVTAETGPAPARPNIVLVLADDQTWRDSGAFGNQDVKTPNIDRLTGEGMKFTHAFTATAMCAPTRQQLYTGLYPVHSGAYPQNSFVKDGTRSLVHYFENLGYRVGISGKRHYAPKASFPFESLNSFGDKDVPNMEEIQAFVNRDPQQPFFLVVASRQPHTPWNKGELDYSPGELSVPDDLVDTPETRKALAAYYREVSDFDSELGQVMDIIEASGTVENTLMIYTSEQGAMYPGAKWTLYDNGIRTAFVVRWPGVVEPSSETDALVAYVDVVPTLVEAAGGEAPAVDGTSFLAVIKGEDDSHREHVFGVHTSVGICNGSEYPIRSVRSRDFKLIVNGNSESRFSNNITVRDPGEYFESWRLKGEAGDADALAKYQRYIKRPAREFYDLKADPFEMNNLADQPGYAAQIEQMISVLESWLAEQGDSDMLATEQAAMDHMLLEGRLKLKTDKCDH